MGELIEAAVGRLREALSLLDAIDHAELLAELPSDAGAAARHQCGVSLIAVLRRELGELAVDLESAHLVNDVLSRLSRADEVK
jgi:hypothetical protein